MSSKRKSGNRKASSSKRTQIYTPDTAPVIFNDEPIVMEEIGNQETSDIPVVNTDNSDSATFQKEFSSVETTEEIKVEKKDYSFLSNRINCLIIGNSKYRNKSFVRIDELVDLILNNISASYKVIVSPQNVSLISNYIRESTNAELKTFLTGAQKNIVVKGFEEDNKLYSL